MCHQSTRTWAQFHDDWDVTQNYANTGFYISVQRLCMHICVFRLESTPGFVHHSRKVCCMFQAAETKWLCGNWTAVAIMNEESECMWVRETTNSLLSGSLATLDSGLLLLPAVYISSTKRTTNKKMLTTLFYDKTKKQSNLPKTM